MESRVDWLGSPVMEKQHSDRISYNSHPTANCVRALIPNLATECDAVGSFLPANTKQVWWLWQGELTRNSTDNNWPREALSFHTGH